MSPFTPEEVVLLRDSALVDNTEARVLLGLDPQPEPENIAARILKITTMALDASGGWPITQRAALIQIHDICLQAPGT